MLQMALFLSRRMDGVRFDDHPPLHKSLAQIINFRAARAASAQGCVDQCACDEMPLTHISTLHFSNLLALGWPCVKNPSLLCLVQVRPRSDSGMMIAMCCQWRSTAMSMLQTSATRAIDLGCVSAVHSSHSDSISYLRTTSS